MYEIDEIDQKIMYLLNLDGRMSSSEVARKLGDTPERTVRNRIDRLVSEGVIQFKAIVNPAAVGLTVTADVWIEVDTGHALEVARRLVEFQEVSYVGCSIGDRDLVVQVNVCSNQELYRFVTDVVHRVQWVRKTSIVLVPMVLKDVYDWKVPDFAVRAKREPAE